MLDSLLAAYSDYTLEYILQEAKKISIDQNLKTILSEAPGKCVPYAVIEGIGYHRLIDVVAYHIHRTI